MKRASFVLVALSFIVASCSGSDNPTGPGGNPGGGGGGGGGTVSTVDTIFLSGVSFSRPNLTVASGRPIVFFKTDNGTPHTVTPSGHSAWNRVSSTGTGEILRVTLTTAGTYNYLCEPHLNQGMTGTITVQ